MTTLKGNWNYPTRVWAGPGRIAELPEACRIAGIARPLVVTDAGLRDLPMTANVLHILKTNAIFADIRGNPVARNVEDGVAAYRAGGHDGVIAFGGGSALDVGKAIAFMAGQTRPLWDFEDVGDWWTRADPNGIAPVVAVPTTAGTGSEVGRASVITNEETHEKKIIFHPKMMPAVVISDAELSTGLPPHITAATGMDAFVHCFEAYLAPGFHPLADGVALNGMALIKEALPVAVADGKNIEARARMLAAASMGATAFQKGLGAVHSIAHPLSAHYDTHHGLANAVLLPFVTAFNMPVIEEKLKPLARLLDLPGGNGDAVLAWILDFRKALGIPNTLAELGIPEDKAEIVGRDAFRDPSTGGNARAITEADMTRIFRAARVGDFKMALG
ncbi:MAG: iron-containing alcohol dehydrogenase [Alphaproteobacteria bacterium]|nr:iron-containing alcohol dehydrogenase [Alphaproteobacteria bacterium]